MAGKSVKELANEIDRLSIIDMSKLEETLEEKLGISVKPKVHFWEHDRYFCMGYPLQHQIQQLSWAACGSPSSSAEAYCGGSSHNRNGHVFISMSGKISVNMCETP